MRINLTDGVIIDSAPESFEDGNVESDFYALDVGRNFSYTTIEELIAAQQKMEAERERQRINQIIAGKEEYEEFKERVKFADTSEGQETNKGAGDSNKGRITNKGAGDSNKGALVDNAVVAVKQTRLLFHTFPRRGDPNSGNWKVVENVNE